VIVDEYQDVNPIQEELVTLLHELGAAVTVVGDDDQTVYQWRGSDVSNILTFPERYPRVRAVRLEDNFRSSKGIVDVARLVIEKNVVRLPKVMRAVDMQDYDTGDITALSFDDPDQEAGYIAQTCKALRGTMVRQAGGSRAITWSDMAVLVRVTACSGPIREALRAEGIPVVSVGMDSLFDTPEAEAARQLFYMMAGRASATETVTAWVNADLGIKRAVLKAAVDTAVATREKMNKENSEVRFAVYNLQRQFIGFLERIGLREETVPDGRGEVVFYNLAKFSQAISDFETIHFHSDPVRKYGAFADFLLHKAEHIYEQSASQAEQSLVPDAVQILTIHKAKGLQWAVVFVPQLMRNRFPIKRSGGTNVWHILPSAGVKGQARFLGSVEDERRLFYVAITRSQKHLHLTTAPTPDNQLYQRASEFWNDVLESKYVKRRRQSYAARRRGTPCQRQGVTDVNLSFSDVKYFFECPYQFKLRILYGFNAPLAEALGYGKSLHDALAELHARAIAGEHIRSQAAAELVDRHLRVPYAYPKLKETLRKAAEQVIAGYIQKRQAEFDKIEFSEKQIEVTLGDGVAVSGRIDLVRRRDTNEIAIVDLKSTERAQTEELTDAQLHVYALGYRELTGKDADFVETYILEENKRRARSVDGDFIEDVKDMVRATAKALRSNQFGPNPVLKNCTRCDFGRMCSAGVAIVSAGKAAASRRAAR
jgi:DNA helicase-2/ATP-dependent DNA helicase PcrA